ncbi:MAG: biopolymer transporter ExbD [Bacteroidota bacterium]|nr:biopolymer transporter ExbD [Bacteroidota bacterium]
MANRKSVEVNAASVADIAFLLLIFFLVATTMDIDTGLSRKLPPMPEEEQVDTDSEIKERNVFVVLIDQSDRLMVEGSQMDIRQLREGAKEFIANKANKENLPEKTEKDIPFFGKTMVSKGIISLQNDNGTTYGMYIKVQNELAAAYNELRNELALSKFGKKFDNLNDEQKKAIRKVYPQVISEAEPKNIGG